VSAQINIRLDDDAVAALDRLASEEGRTRAELVREAVQERLRGATQGRVAAAYREAYEDHPETAAELRRAEQAARRLVAEEPWERWW
jgi:predicted DNA-binding protein